MFNSLQYARMLEEVGLSREQAEMHIKILIEIMEQNLATKNDISELGHKIEKSEFQLTIKFGSMLALSIGIIATLLKLFLK